MLTFGKSYSVYSMQDFKENPIGSARYTPKRSLKIKNKRRRKRRK